MSLDKLVTGCVIRYPYLWDREAQSGETEGRKSNRPTTVGFRLRNFRGNDQLILFPITTKQPGSDRFAVEIPDTQKKLAGLDSDLRQWIIFDEYNADIIGKSYYLQPSNPLGNLSYEFLKPHLREFIKLRSSVRRVDRSKP